MANIFGPILPIQLDSRNTEALVRAIQTRIYLESDGVLNDFTPASPLSAISEGQAFAQSELLYYLNNLPEAFSIQWLRQLGIQRKLGSKSIVDVTFYKVPGFQRVLIIPKGTRLFADGGQAFITLEEVRVSEAEFSKTITCQSERWGSAYNVGIGQINKVERNFAGLEFLRNEVEAAGGSDIETIAEMKQRAFEVLARRNLTTSTDYENEVRTLVPEASIVKVLTYEERNNLSSLFSGNIVICVGDTNGKALEKASLGFLIDSIKSRVVIGTNVSFLPPDIIPIDLVLEVYYDPLTNTVGSDVLANDIFLRLREYIDPLNIELGTGLSYQELAKVIYEFDFVKNINSLDVKAMVRSEDNIDGPCAGFSGEESEDETKCFFNYAGIVDPVKQSFDFDISPITSFKLYRAQIALTSINDFSSLTFSYDNLYTP